MSAAKKQASKEGQNTNSHVQLIITTFFTQRENKQKQRRPVKDKPEVDTKKGKAATCASNKEKISRGITNKLSKIQNPYKNELSNNVIPSVKVINNIKPLTMKPIFQMYEYIPIPGAAETTASPVTTHSSMRTMKKHLNVSEIALRRTKWRMRRTHTLQTP